jgi:hypothetical protein
MAHYKRRVRDALRVKQTPTSLPFSLRPWLNGRTSMHRHIATLFFSAPILLAATCDRQPELRPVGGGCMTTSLY